MTPKFLARRIVSAATQAFWSPDDLLGEIQTTLAALADVEYRYERDRERLGNGLVLRLFSILCGLSGRDAMRPNASLTGANWYSFSGG